MAIKAKKIQPAKAEAIENAKKIFSEYNDFMTEYAGRTIDFIMTNNRAHDRYIIIDNATNNMKLYHCGASSKDAGKRITTISRIMEVDVYKSSIQQLLANPVLILK